MRRRVLFGLPRRLAADLYQLHLHLIALAFHLHLAAGEIALGAGLEILGRHRHQADELPDVRFEFDDDVHVASMLGINRSGVQPPIGFLIICGSPQFSETSARRRPSPPAIRSDAGLAALCRRVSSSQSPCRSPCRCAG